MLTRIDSHAHDCAYTQAYARTRIPYALRALTYNLMRVRTHATTRARANTQTLKTAVGMSRRWTVTGPSHCTSSARVLP